MKAYKVGRVGGENTKLYMFLSLGEWKGNVMALRKGKKKKNQQKSVMVQVPWKHKTFEKQW